MSKSAIEEFKKEVMFASSCARFLHECYLTDTVRRTFYFYKSSLFSDKVMWGEMCSFGDDRFTWSERAAASIRRVADLHKSNFYVVLTCGMQTHPIEEEILLSTFVYRSGTVIRCGWRFFGDIGDRFVDWDTGVIDVGQAMDSSNAIENAFEISFGVPDEDIIILLSGCSGASSEDLTRDSP